MSKKRSEPEIDPIIAAEILRRLDVLAEMKKYGFIQLGPQDAGGWLPGRFTDRSGREVTGLLNVGWGESRGDFKECDLTRLGYLPGPSIN
jgi:hypothetical protein